MEQTFVAVDHHAAFLYANYPHLLKQGHGVDQCYLTRVVSNAESSCHGVDTHPAKPRDP